MCVCVCVSVGVQFACACVNVFEFQYVIRIEECYFQAYPIETQSQAVLIKNARTATVPMHVCISHTVALWLTYFKAYSD